MSKKILFVLPLLLLLSACASQKSGGVKLDDLLNVANSTSVKNIAKITSSSDPQAAAKALLEHKRLQWERDPAQLIQDIKVAKHDFDNLMNALSGNVQKKWGKKETKLPGRKTYVKYSKQYKSRAIVDFERGEISIESLEENADAGLKNAIVTTLLTPEDPASVDVFTDSAVDLSSKRSPFLLGLVLNDAGQEISTPELAAGFADKQLLQIKMRKIETGNGEKQVRYVAFRMVANFEDQKAHKYLQFVRKYAKQYNVSPSLVLGVIKTESSFNPHAVSGAPAYGLMQLVPTSGGREGYRRAKQQDTAPSKDYLFEAENNIELGTAYLSVLLYEQLDGVSDRTARDYCVISAYNTGPGNVMKAFTTAKGKQRFEEGLQRINSATPSQVFQTLREKLPYEETRHYLPTVNTNRKNYYSVDKTVIADDAKPSAMP